MIDPPETCLNRHAL